VTVVDYSDATLDVHYDYGEYGERTQMQEKSGSTVMASTSYSYDSFKRLSSETRSFNGLSGSYSVGYTYNYANALKQVSYTVGAWSKSVNYDYNYAGAPTKVGSNLRTGDTTNNVATAFDFRAWGALQKADYANGRRLALGYNQKRSQMTNLKLQKTDNSDVVSNISYDYYNGGGGSGGNNGRIRYITDHLDGNYSVDVGYDDYNRLTSYGGYRSYTYDAWNNLLSVSSSNGVGEAPNYTLTNASGAPVTNRINNSGYTYDNAGNVTNDGSLAYAYDAAGRLKTAGTNNSCEYDGDGRKVKQVSGGYPLFYLWSSVLGEPVVELDSSGGVYRAYVLSSGGQMLAVQSYDGGFYWLHTDHLGNGRKLTNSSGTVIYRAEFDPHGQMLYEWQSSGQTYLNSHKFTGYERDWATNLNYAKARTYNHNRARFMQPDPLGLGAADTSNPQSLNRYSYVENDSMNAVDPSGLLLVRFCTADQWIPNEAGGELISGICYLVEIGYGGFGGGPYHPIVPVDPRGGPAGGGEPQGSRDLQDLREVKEFQKDPACFVSRKHCEAKCSGQFFSGAANTATAIGTALWASGQPIIPKPVVLGGSSTHTSLASQFFKNLFPDARLPGRWPAPTSKAPLAQTTRLSTFLGRATPIAGGVIAGAGILIGGSLQHSTCVEACLKAEGKCK